MAERSVNVILSEKGKQLLVINDYKYCKAHVSKQGEIRWRCVNKNKCPAVVYTMVNNEDQIIREKDALHNHDPSSTIAREAVSNSVKRKAVENPSERPSKLVNRELIKNDWDISTEDLACIKRNLYIARRSVMPALPKNQDEVFDIVNQMDLKTHKEETFKIASCKESKIILFSCLTNLYFLCSVNTLYMDGTFQYCSKFFYQLFTIHAFKNGNYVSVVFALLPNKTYDTYVNLLTLLRAECIKLNLNLRPTRIVSDFELAIPKACKFIWNEVVVKGCRFHLSQSWFRKIQELGLVREYKDKESKIGEYLRIHFGIMLLSPEEALQYFNTELYFLLPEDDRVRQFREYLHINYFSVNANFPPNIWSNTGDFEFSTTNACESFHSKFGNNFYNSHPNIIQFTQQLIELQVEVYIKIGSAHNPKKQRIDIVNKIKNIKQSISDYENKTISRHSFVKYVSYKFLPKVL